MELNCGTGTDAIEIANHVKCVLATDISLNMIAEGKSKAAKKVQNILFKVAGIQDLKEELSQAELIFSNFGGLNCLSRDEMKSFAAHCNENVREGTDLFFVILGRKCTWEKLYFLWKGNKQSASRRSQKSGVQTIINNNTFYTFYYSPEELCQFLGNGFKVKSNGAVGLFVPPSYLNPFFKNKIILLRLFNRLDAFFCNFRWSARYGDHYYIHLKRES